MFTDELSSCPAKVPDIECSINLVTESIDRDEILGQSYEWHLINVECRNLGSVMKVLIVGGGIGGLTAALCCHHFGHDVTVFEKASVMSEVGAGIQLSPNAMKVFNALGIEKQISEQAFRPEKIEARMGESGRHIFSIPLAQHAVQKWGALYLHIHRADYIAALKSALETKLPNAIKTHAQVVRYTQDASQAVVHLADGRQFAGDVLIGADGIKSNIRQTMFGDDKPEFTGNVAWRVVVETEALEHPPNPTACVWMGRGRHGVTYRLRQGKLVNFVGVVERDDWRQESWTERGDKQDALHDFKGWHPSLTAILERADEASLYRWALFDRKPLPRWTDGRIALLGDAAHPMLPFLAQGAAMAVEDAWSLAANLSAVERPSEQSLLAYEKSRLARTSKVQAASRANMKTFHQPSRAGQIITYGPMWAAGQLMPSIVHNRLNWLYGYGVTGEG